MDFSLEYSAGQERFAEEVRKWLDENIPPDLIYIRDPNLTSYEQWRKRREFARKLAEKGWLWPGYPLQYGGGGLDGEHCSVLNQEVAKRGLSLPPYYDAATLALPAILNCGTEEQKKRFLPPMLRGEAITWQLFTEPEAGTDEANQQTNALRHTRDGEFFVVSGQKIFVGSTHCPPGQFLLLTRSDLEAPRHGNLAMFLAPANLPGITIMPLDLFPSGPFGVISGPSVDTASGVKQQVFFDDVRIHEKYLIGGDRDGWRVASATLAVEHGDREGAASGRSIARNVVAEKFLAQCKDNPKIANRLKENPHLVERVLDVYISAQIERLLSMRNAWLPRSGKRLPYAGPQLALRSKMFGTRIIADMIAVAGPYSLVDGGESCLDEGIFEVGERCGICVAPGGTPEALKIGVSRGLRLGR